MVKNLTLLILLYLLPNLEIQIGLDLYFNRGLETHKESQSVASSCKLKLDRFSTLLRIQDIAKCGKDTELQWGRNRKEETCTGRGGHRTYLLDEWNKSGGETTQH